MRWRCRTKSFLARQCERNGCFATPRKGKPMNSRLIAVSTDNQLDYHRQLAELDSLYRNSRHICRSHKVPRNWEDWCAIFWMARKNGPFRKLARATERFRG